MKTHTYLKVIAVACVGALASCATKPEVKTTRMPVSATLRPDSSLTGQVLQEVNSYRRSHGASDLERHTGLDRLAQEHSEYLRQHRGTFSLSGKNISHIGFEGRTLVARERYQMDNISENLVATNYGGKNPAPTLVKLWSESKGHDVNMRGEWTHTGIGLVVDSDGMVFCTQLFSTVNHSQMTMRQRFRGF
ncbi:MAG: CAP domain-containing protein [Verrucomicrobiota bacterium]